MRMRGCLEESSDCLAIWRHCTRHSLCKPASPYTRTTDRSLPPQLRIQPAEHLSRAEFDRQATELIALFRPNQIASNVVPIPSLAAHWVQNQNILDAPFRIFT